MDRLQGIADDIHRSKLSETATTISGGSNTGQVFHATGATDAASTAAAHAAPSANGAEARSRASALTAAIDTATTTHPQNHSRTRAPLRLRPSRAAYRNGRRKWYAFAGSKAH
jgi:hypothetical protein